MRNLSRRNGMLAATYSPREWLEYDYRVWSYVAEVECKQAPKFWITDLSTVPNSVLIREIDRLRSQVLKIYSESAPPPKGDSKE